MRRFEPVKYAYVVRVPKNIGMQTDAVRFN